MKIAVAGATGLIGTMLVAAAQQAGHDAVPLSRRSGFDLTDSSVQPHLVEALRGVDALIDVTQGSSFEEDEATEFFRSVATNLGQAATEAGVQRTVVLSIVGIDRSPDYGYYVAKVAQEEAHRKVSPGVVVLRATQFHEFAIQMIDWFTTDGVAEVMDVQVQPVSSDAVVNTLLELALSPEARDVQLAGPQQEDLVTLARRAAQQRGLDVTVVPGGAPTSMREGSMLPQPDDQVVVRGVTWAEWMNSRLTG